MNDVAVPSARPRQLLLLPTARPLVERFGGEFFRALPNRPGVYLMCGISEGVIYVGKAKNLRQRLGSYRSAHPDRLSRKIRRLLVSVERIYWDECGDEAAAIARERELLLALQPKFNTVGTYPAPQHHLGWQQTMGGLRLGFGEVTNGWERRYGKFARVRPVCAALRRLIWRALNPSAPLHDMPSLLLDNKPAPALHLRASHPKEAAALDEVTQRLDDFLRGRSSDFPEWLLLSGGGHSRFEDQWRESDALCLREFYERHFAPETE